MPVSERAMVARGVEVGLPKDRLGTYERVGSQVARRVLSATVRCEAERRYVSRSVEVERTDPCPHKGGIVGVDHGLKAFSFLSDGAVVAPGKALVRAIRAL